MSDSETDSNPSQLSEFLLGPAWARASAAPQVFKPRPDSDKRRDDGPPRRDDRSPAPRGREDRRPSQDRKPPFQNRRDTPPPEPQEIYPAPGVRITLRPDRQAVHLIGKEIHQVARVYSLFDVAEILVAERSRCRALFEVSPKSTPLFHGKLDGSLFLTKDEAIRHLWNSELTKQVLEEETVEVDPPSGRYQAVARCGISGVWLGPPNHHAYQPNLRRLHRERFSHMPFEFFAGKVRTERSEEAVAAWLETMKTKQRWRVIGEDDDAWMEDKAAAEHAVATRCFDHAYAETRAIEISAGIPTESLSPALFASLRQAGLHAKRNPAILIPSVCAALEAERLPVFKRSGKLFTGPARPHPLPRDVSLAERPARIVEWIRNNKPAKLAGLWQAVHPTGGTEPCLEYANDLFWLLNQGHILLFTDDTLIVQELRDPEAAPEPKPTRREKLNRQAAKPPKEKPLLEEAVAAEEAVAGTAESTAVTEESAVTEEPAVTEESAVTEEPAVTEESGVEEETVVAEEAVAVPEEAVLAEAAPDLEQAIVLPPPDQL